ncbi:hypothetical protein LAZ67_10000222 [Cordylochernes scorpioides]|uniref:RNase H type-1 domain-containing protein n=1 Tax=Cordylochernes scorpioides TaxID=51811 RepID=A0ABY6KVE1_9ARAC|nr:hypothetical protein LAZ67_10000222 [Cordylochernes scorpioides]
MVGNAFRAAPACVALGGDASTAASSNQPSPTPPPSGAKQSNSASVKQASVPSNANSASTPFGGSAQSLPSRRHCPSPRPSPGPQGPPPLFPPSLPRPSPLHSRNPPLPHSTSPPLLSSQTSPSRSSPPSAPDFDYYTDGSKSRSGVGAGIARISSSPLSSRFPLPLDLSIPLASHCSIFQAECFAFQTALTDLSSLPPSLSTAISSDSLLYSLLPSRNLTLHWVKGHSDNFGNCLADSLAKGATIAPSLPPKYALASKTTHHKFLSHHFWSLWEDEFISARPSFFLRLGLTPSSLSSSHSFLLPSSAIATGLLTGHTFIAANPHRRTPPPFDPTCPHCNQAPETIEHIFFDCPDLDSLRATFFQNCLTNLGLIPTSLPQLFSSSKAWALAFATHSNRFVPSNIPQSSSDSDTST